VFRIAPRAVPDISADELNQLNQLYYRNIDKRKDIMLTRTELNGVHCVRYEEFNDPGKCGNK
jgi:aromatic-L-amino-acid decarboxylase